MLLDWPCRGWTGSKLPAPAHGAAGAPILILTARGSEDDRVRGLQAGADDYLTKPFGSAELLARIDALARRASIAPSDAERLEIDGCLLDLGRCLAHRHGDAIPLTPREVGILRWLHRHRARAVSARRTAADRVGAPASGGELETRTVDMTIANLRQKIEREPAEPRIIVTVKGVGYAWGRDMNRAPSCAAIVVLLAGRGASHGVVRVVAARARGRRASAAGAACAVDDQASARSPTASAQRLEELRRAESQRPYFHYQNLYHDPKGASEGLSVVPSPLASGRRIR